MAGQQEFKNVLLSLDYDSDKSMYANNWKSVVPELIDIVSKYPTEFHKDWIFGLCQIESAIMHTVCDVCDDKHFFKWLKDLKHAYETNTQFPDMPSCADCHSKSD
jgi:hypothetical protein